MMRSFAELMDSGKLSKPIVLYLPDDGGKKRCGRCIMFLKDILRCSIHGKDVPIKESMVCGMYLPGGPSSSDHMTAIKSILPEQSGLIDTNDDGTHCESCIHSNRTSTKCELVKGEIEPDGCCNFWENEKIEKPYKSGE